MKPKQERIETLSRALAQEIDARTIEGTLWRREGGKLRCLACGHRCLIAPGRRGICRVRFNPGGEEGLRVPFGYVAGMQCDPVEKKPFFHVYPGSDALTFGMLGCDFHCPFCQNWLSSQVLRNEAADAPIHAMDADKIISTAKQCNARLIVSSYNEPLISAEWARAIFEKAAPEGFICAFVSNGHATPEAIDFLRPYLHAFKVDLKTFEDAKYRKLGGVLEVVKSAICTLHWRGVWVEIVTLLIPGFNDSEEELRQMARFIASVDPEIPWHITAFHPDYQSTDRASTRPEDLIHAAEIGADEGLKFVYAGNLPGKVGRWENTYCPTCQTELISRFGFVVQANQLTPDGLCPSCRTQIPGIWSKSPTSGTISGGSWDFYEQLPSEVE